MTALRFQTGGRHLTSPASLRGRKRERGGLTDRDGEGLTDSETETDRESERDGLTDIERVTVREKQTETETETAHLALNPKAANKRARDGGGGVESRQRDLSQ